jgi:DNA-binding transcriptional LysR family regulator
MLTLRGIDRLALRLPEYCTGVGGRPAFFFGDRDVTLTSTMTSGAMTIGNDVDVRRLLYFSVIVEHGSMGQAAKVLRISQPALSIAMDKLEKELGATLLLRTSKGIEPTEIGEALVRHARGILVSVAAVEREFRGGRSPVQEVLRFGCLPTLAGSVIAQAIRQWQLLYPRLELHVTECPQNELLWGLLRREYDFTIGVVDATNYAHGLRQRVLFHEIRFCRPILLFIPGSLRRPDGVIPRLSIFSNQRV